jgi:hypothetical protein
LALGLAGCANNTGAASGPASSAPAVTDLPSPSTLPSSAEIVVPSPTKPVTTETKTISGTVTAGVEPNCLLLQDASGSHLLVFSDAAMRADTPVGAKVTLTGHAEPRMMSTCQQGVPFVITAVRAS